jgi:hypothetical protein
MPTTSEEATIRMLYDCRKYQSLSDVQALVERFPDCLRSANHLAQTPLHVAASAGVNCEVLTFLILSYPQACWVIDVHGKLPLHYVASPSKWIVPAGCGPFGDDERDAGNSLDPQYSSVLKQLCLVYPQAANHEDFVGRNPIELALGDPASDYSIVRLLQRASTRHWKQTKRAEIATAISTIKEDARRAVASCTA